MKLITTFLNSLQVKGVRYVHWKSNTNIKQALSGIDDLDILVDPNNEKEFNRVLKDLKFIRAFSSKDHWQDGITNYIGLDVESQKLVHVHLHYQLSLGYDFDKCFTLPIVDTYLKEITHYQNKISLPSYENEYCVLVIRLILKNSLTPFLLSLPNQQFKLIKNSKREGIVIGSAYDEFLDLKSKISREKLDETLAKNFKFLSKEIFDYCETTLSHNREVLSFFKAGKRIKKELACYREYGEPVSFSKAFVRLYSIRFFTLIRKLKIYDKSKGKKPENGGRVIAFVGGDGAGKTTTISKLKKTLEKQFSVKSIHVGKPRSSVTGFTLKIVAKLLSIIGLSNFAKAFIYLSIAIDRNKEFKRACKYRDKGFIVLQDRIPLEGITAMDCPRVHLILDGKFKKISNFEKKQYHDIKGVDQLYVLKVDPEIAIKRRPNDNPDELRIRSGQIWKNEWYAPYAHEINTGVNNPDEVQRVLLKKVWENLNKKFVRTEIVGLNGTGKTSLLQELERSTPNTQKNIIITKYPALMFKSFSNNLFGCARVYAKTRSLNLARVYFHLKTSLLILEKWKNSSCTPNKNLVFDQGPIFQLVMLHKEKCISKDNFVELLHEIKPIFTDIIFLTAPINILYERVGSRSYSDGRGQYMNFEEFEVFCEAYQKSFQLIHNIRLPIVEINTAKSSSNDIHNRFRKVFYEK
jgi:thymidylate kinase